MSQQNKVEQKFAGIDTFQVDGLDIKYGNDAGFPTYQRTANYSPDEILNMQNLQNTPHNPQTGSIKNDTDKFDPSMLTIELVELLSRVRMFGAKKYARNNFKISGFKYTRSCAAALRHIFQFLNGEDLDPESGLSHLGHAVASLEHCIYDIKNHPENDDRKS